MHLMYGSSLIPEHGQRYKICAFHWPALNASIHTSKQSNLFCLQLSSHLCQVHEPRACQIAAELTAGHNHHGKCASSSTASLSGELEGARSVLGLSFRATLFCSKLPMPSRPQRDIIALSYKKIGKVLHVLRKKPTSSQGEPSIQGAINI